MDKEDKVIARAQRAWDEGRPEEAGRILEEYLREHPERAAALKGRGFAGPGDQRAAPVPPPASMPCLRCDEAAPYAGRMRLHEGSNLAPFILGDFGELLVDAVSFDVYGCKDCGHVEFFLPGRARDPWAE